MEEKLHTVPLAKDKYGSLRCNNESCYNIERCANNPNAGSLKFQEGNTPDVQFNPVTGVVHCCQKVFDFSSGGVKILDGKLQIFSGFVAYYRDYIDKLS